MKWHILLVAITFVMLINFVEAQTFNNCEVYGNCKPVISGGGTNFNNNTAYVNNSGCWNGHCSDDGSWLTNINTFNITYNNLLNENCPDGYVMNGTLPNGTILCTVRDDITYISTQLATIYVPYTGATKSVDLATHSLTGYNLVATNILNLTGNSFYLEHYLFNIASNIFSITDNLGLQFISHDSSTGITTINGTGGVNVGGLNEPVQISGNYQLPSTTAGNNKVIRTNGFGNTLWGDFPTGSCSGNQAVQNTTVSGVQCLDLGVYAKYNFTSTFNGTLNFYTTGNISASNLKDINGIDRQVMFIDGTIVTGNDNLLFNKTGLLIINGSRTADGLTSIGQVTINGVNGDAGLSGSAVTIATGTGGNNLSGTAGNAGAVNFNTGAGGAGFSTASSFTGATGGNLQFTPGNGGSTANNGTGTSVRGGQGGGLVIALGSGGAGTSNGSNMVGGATGAFNVNGNDASVGGTASSTIAGTNTGGAGTGCNFISGQGGTASNAGTNVGGAGGAFAFRTGSGGSATSSAGKNGTGGGGGALSFIGRNGGGSSGGGINTGGNGSQISFTSGTGGNALTGSSNTGGRGGDIVFQSGVGGTGSTANGGNGNIVFKSSTTEIGRFDNTVGSVGYFRLTADNQKMQFGTSQDASLLFDGNSFNIKANEVTTSDIIELQSNVTITSGYDLNVSWGDVYANRNLKIMGNFSAKRAYWNGYDNSTQPFLNTANAQIINISNNNDYSSWQIAVENQQNLTFQRTGDYLCILSPEFFQSSGGSSLITFWFQICTSGTCTDVAWSNSRYTVPNNGYNAPSIPYQFSITSPSTQKVRFMWWSDSTFSQIYSSGVLTAPTRPSIPGILLNCQKVSEVV